MHIIAGGSSRLITESCTDTAIACDKSWNGFLLPATNLFLYGTRLHSYSDCFATGQLRTGFFETRDTKVAILRSEAFVAASFGDVLQPRMTPNHNFSDRLTDCSDANWTVRINDDVDDSDVFQTGMSVLRRRGHVLVAICLNNGYYKRSRIEKLLQVAASLSPEVTVFFTDGPAVHNYLALGRSESYALKQTRKQYHQLRNACDETIARLHGLASFRFIDWASVYARTDYRTTYSELLELYNTNHRFRHEVRQATQAVLARHQSNRDLEAAVDIGILYSLEELAFLSCYDAMALELVRPTSGDPQFAYIYHLRWDILERLANGVYDGIKRPNLGFIVLSIQPRKLALLEDSASKDAAQYHASDA